MPEQLGLLAQEQQSPKPKGLGLRAWGVWGLGVHSGAVWASKILGSLEFKPMPKAVKSTLNYRKVSSRGKHPERLSHSPLKPRNPKTSPLRPKRQRSFTSTHRPLSSSFSGFPCRILIRNHKTGTT